MDNDTVRFCFSNNTSEELDVFINELVTRLSRGVQSSNYLETLGHLAVYMAERASRRTFKQSYIGTIILTIVILLVILAVVINFIFTRRNRIRINNMV